MNDPGRLRFVRPGPEAAQILLERHSTGLLLAYTGPGKRFISFGKRSVLGYFPVTEYKAVRKSPAGPIDRIFQTNPCIKVDNNLVSVDEKVLGLAAALGPRPASRADILAHLCDAAIGARARKPLGLNAQDV